MEKSTDWFFCRKGYSLQNYSTKSFFVLLCFVYVYDLSYDLQTYIKQSISYVIVRKIFKFSHQLLISFKWTKSVKVNLVYFKNITMATASLSTIKLRYFNNAIFSAITRIRHTLKQRADIKSHEFKGITRQYLQNHLNKLIKEKKIINKVNRDQDSYRINRDLKSHEFDQARSPVSLSNSSFNNSPCPYFLH